jgi:thiosulfate/3-mercaptopyruvate sulfurtransferase
MHVSQLPRVVDAAWLAEHLDDDDVVVGDVRGPNAHMRGPIPRSRPLVLGSPPPGADEASVLELAKEVALRLRRHGITGEERLVLVDRGDGVGAMPAAQMAELAGHPQVAILLGGMAAWPGELAEGAVELEPVRSAAFEPNVRAFPTRQELASRLDDPALTILDVRREEEYTGRRGSPCDPRQGHIPRAHRLEVGTLFAGPGQPQPAERIRELVGRPEGAEIVAYCHSGSRSALATLALRSAGYDARNYAGSWHEWSRHPELPLER